MNVKFSHGSISDSSDSEEELSNWHRISKTKSTAAVPTEQKKAKCFAGTPAPTGSKKAKSVPVIDIADSSDDSDSDDSRPTSTISMQSDSGALAQLLTINKRPKPQHANLISRPPLTTTSRVLPPRHPTLESESIVIVEKEMHSTRRVSPTPSGMSSMTLQSARQKSLLLWRRRLWPSLAAFYRIILRCRCKYSPPALPHSASLTSVALQDIDLYSEMRQGDVALEWGSFWDPSALSPLPVHFSSVAEHNRQMFLLLLEECRFSMSSSISKEPRGHPLNHHHHHHSHHQNSDLQWQRGEVKTITSNLRDSLSSLSPSSSSAGKPDPRLGSLWILQVQLLPPKRARSESDLSTASTSCESLKGFQVGGAERSRFVPQSEAASAAYSREGSSSASNLSGLEMVEGYRPGDLLVCRNQQWGNRLALGVVQGYDPDYDILLSSPSDDSQFTTVQLLVCVEGRDGVADAGGAGRQSESSAQREPSGWIDTDSMQLCQGTILHLSVIGNLTTSLRECQAISSLASLRPSLRDIILCHPEKHYENYLKSKPHPSESHADTGHHKERCPGGVSGQLWAALCSSYNKSQLRAMASVIEEPRAVAVEQSTRSDKMTSTGAGPDDDKLQYPLILLQGPPGTGKTSTIMGIVAVLLDAGVPSDSPAQQGKKIRIGSSLTGVASKSRAPTSASASAPAPPTHVLSASATKTRILLCAPSNTAVDELVFRLKKYGVLGKDGRSNRSLCVVRIGQPLNSTRATSSTEGECVDVKEFTLDYLVDKRRREIETTQQIGYYRPRMPNTLQLRHQVLEQADIVCCTLSGSGSPQLLESIINNGASGNSAKNGGDSTSSGDGTNTSPPFQFDVVIIDEAAQAVEPSALIPLKYNPKVLIMVGDACQLRATVLSKEASKFNFGRSLFERLDLAGFPKQMLLTQYRMHPDIALFPSNRFYEGKLTNDSRMTPSHKNKGCKGSHWKSFHADPSKRLRPMVFHNVWRGREELSGSSYCNRAEAEYILDLFGSLRRNYPNACSGGVGIITAYKAQKHLLKQMFKQQYGHNWSSWGSSGKKGAGGGGDVEISTVDGFQGREKDVIIFSCVRSSSKHSQHSSDHSSIGFMSDHQRLNVALTRAKYALWVVGDVRTMTASGRQGGESIWRDLIEHCHKHGFMYDSSKRN